MLDGRHVLGQSTLYFCYGRHASRARERVPSVDEEPPTRHRVPKIAWGVIIDLHVRHETTAPALRLVTRTEPTSDAITALAPMDIMVDTCGNGQLWRTVSERLLVPEGYPLNIEDIRPKRRIT